MAKQFRFMLGIGFLLFAIDAPLPVITINLTLNETFFHPDDPDGSQLEAIVSAAAGRWEDILEDPHDIDILNGWGLVGGQGLGATTVLPADVVGGRPVNAIIEFDTQTNPAVGSPVDVLWHFDPTPTDHSEFDMQQTLFRDLTGGAPDLFYNGSPPNLLEVDFGGNALGSAPPDAQNGFDLFTVAMHELGHAMGMITNVASGETGDQEFDVNSNLVRGASMAVTVRATADREHIRANNALMFDVVQTGNRRLPGATDVFAIATSPSPG
jgi:hypothetical protein